MVSSIRNYVLAGSILNVANGGGSLIGSYFSYTFLPTFVLLALVEGAILLLIAGSLDLTSSVFYTKVRELLYKSREQYSLTEHNQAQRRANAYIVLGAVMIAESVLISFVIA